MNMLSPMEENYAKFCGLRPDKYPEPIQTEYGIWYFSTHDDRQEWLDKRAKELTK